MLLVLQRIFGGENSAPRVAQQKEVPGVQAECDTDLLHLVDEPVELPELRLVGLVAVERAELVVVVVLDARPPAGTQSQGSKYSWVAAGPPCRSRSFAVGLLPNRLVQT